MTMLETKTTLAPLSDLNNILTLGPFEESEESAAPVDVRVYAGGRRRIITTPGESRTVSVSWRYMSRNDFEALRDLVGVPILFRDSRFRRIFGVFGAVSASEWRPKNELEQVSITVTETTFSEVV